MKCQVCGCPVKSNSEHSLCMKHKWTSPNQVQRHVTGPSIDDCASRIVDRDPCVCGTRKDMHDQFGCKRYRRAA